MAIDDNTSYELTGSQVKDLANKIKSKAADSTFTGATSAVAGVKGIVPEPQAGDDTKYLKGDGTWATIVPSLVEMSYGETSAWSKFINAYNAGAIVYCRASSNSNPATGTQGRKAFMAYVNNATTPTEVEFQYVRSVNSKTDSQQGDQVFIYKLTNASGGTWTVTTRNMSAKINVSGPITKTFTTGANATVTIGANAMTGATSSAAGTAGVVPAPSAGDNTKFLRGDGTWTSMGGSYLASTTQATVTTSWSDLYTFDISSMPTGAVFAAIGTILISTSVQASAFARWSYNGADAGHAENFGIRGRSITSIGSFTKAAGANTLALQGYVSDGANGAWGCSAVIFRIA